ncbi:unnamed protein product, partial [Meganyctiphanes norvegica]
MKTYILSLLVVGAFAAPSRKPTFRKGLNRIIGGNEVAPGELSYQLSLQDLSFGTEWHFCGASIYNENWAICAAHCVDGMDVNNLQIVAGEHNMYIDEGNEQTILLSSVFMHEQYDVFTLSSDISLLQLSKPLTFNEYVQPIALPEAGHVATGDCVVSGFGITSEAGNTQGVLMKITLPIMSEDECRKGYGEALGDCMICAGLPEGGKDACQGDSGGPLACSDTGSTYLAGIISWGYGCARPGFPGVYTEVSCFVDWIKQNTT